MRTTSMRKKALFLAMSVAVLGYLGSHASGYVSSGHRWGVTQVSYYVNPSSIHVSPSAAVAAIQQAAAVWSEQSRANIKLVYAGTTGGGSLALNNKNEVFFRNASDGGAVASTYWWYDGSGHLVDADIVFWEASYKFHYGSGCTNGIYVENVAVHEFGHALGLEHSAVSGATMAPAMSSYCDRTQLTLEADDIQGIESIYGTGSTTPPPAAPSSLAVAVNTSSPTSSLVLSWADNSNNESGFRVERSRDGGTWVQAIQLGANVRSFTDSSLSADTLYYYRVYAFSSDGNSAYSNTARGQTTAAVAPAPSPSVYLTARGYKVKGQGKVDLAWGGFSSSSVTIYRNGAAVKTVGASGTWTDAVNTKGGGRYIYKACESGTSVCSSEAAVTF